MCIKCTVSGSTIDMRAKFSSVYLGKLIISEYILLTLLKSMVEPSIGLRKDKKIIILKNSFNYFVMQSDGNCFGGDVVLDRVNIASRDDVF